MKALLCKTTTLLLFLSLIAGGSQAKEVKKTLKKEFKTSGSTVLNIETKFSELTIDTGNQNTASFDVTIVAEHSNEEKAAKILELMTVEFEQNCNEISVSTEIDDKFKKMDWGETKKIKFIIQARIPADLTLSLDNNFGSVVISELTGQVKLENNYGSVGAKALSGKTELELNYGDAKIGKLGPASIEVNYGELTVEEADDLEVEVNFGDCTIKQSRNVSAEVNMGDLKIQKVLASFTELSLENSTGSIEVGIDRNAGFVIDAEMSMGSINVPDLDKIESRKSGMSQRISGTYGNGKSKISAEGSMGSIEITLR